MGIPVGIAPVALQQFFDVDGNPLAGGLLYTYASGTTTPLATYADAGGVTVNPNPMVLDSGGFASPGLFLQALAYTFALTDSNNIPQWSQDGVVSEQAIANGLNQPSGQVIATSGMFTVPTNVGAVKVTLIGGGGAGGGATSSFSGGGGGSGGIAIAWLTGLVPGNTLDVTIGAGGTPVSGNTGGAGGATTLSSGTQTITTITANGGGGGFTSGAASPGGAGAAISTNATANGAGFNGAGASGAIGANGIGGNGGSTFLGGAGGCQGTNSTAGIAAISKGAGGGGAAIGATNSGGAGSAGVAIFEYLQ